MRKVQEIQLPTGFVSRPGGKVLCAAPRAQPRGREEVPSPARTSRGGPGPAPREQTRREPGSPRPTPRTPRRRFVPAGRHRSLGDPGAAAPGRAASPSAPRGGQPGGRGGQPGGRSGRRAVALGNSAGQPRSRGLSLGRLRSLRPPRTQAAGRRRSPRRSQDPRLTQKFSTKCAMTIVPPLRRVPRPHPPAAV